MTVATMNKPDELPWIAKVSIVIGRRGSGKTTFVQKIMELQQRKVLIIDTLDHPHYRQYQIIEPEMVKRWKKGVKRVLVNESNFNEVMAMFRDNENKTWFIKDTLVIFEDAGKYITDQKIPPFLRSFVLDTKQILVDVIFLYHCYGDVVKRLFRYADYLTIFKNNDDIDEQKSRVGNFSTVRKYHLLVMENEDPYFNLTVRIN